MTNESSSEKINYYIRPAKQVERKLMIEALQCLKKSYDISRYNYVGMGSLYFVDFQMVHKFLGINKMISMEMDEEKIKRYEFNKPYTFIEVIPGLSTQTLPTLNWNQQMLIWLDYDSKISKSMIEDIQIICQNSRRGNILIVTIDAEPKRFEDEYPKDHQQRMLSRLDNIKMILHPHYPTDIRPSDLSLKKFPSLLHRIVTDTIKDTLGIKHFDFFQIFNIVYEDTSQMYTFGCVFEKDEKKISESCVLDLQYVSPGANLKKIKLPILTQKEKIYFDKLIPNIQKKLKCFEMSQEKLSNYEEYYKYYPQYFEALL